MANFGIIFDDDIIEKTTRKLYEAYNCDFPLSFYTDGDFSMLELTGYSMDEILNIAQSINDNIPNV